VGYETRGVSPNREFVVQFRNVPYKYFASTLNTFQYVLYEGTNDIHVNYLDITSYGEAYTVAGIENADGTIGLQYPKMNTAGNFKNFYIRYSVNQVDSPIVTTGEATSATASSVTLNGTVNPNGVNTTSYFQYGTSAGYGSTTTSTNIGSGTSHVPVSVAIANLTPNTTYHYRIVATNSAGTSYGDDQTFTTSSSFSSRLLYFPHIASHTGNWETEICVINISGTQTLNGVFKAYNNAGVHISEDITIDLDPHGRREITVGDEFSDPGSIGYIVFEPDFGAVLGYTKFYVEGYYRAAVPAVSEINTSDIYISHIASDSNWWTGISLLNTTSLPKTLTIEFDNGETKTVDLLANENKAFTIRSLFDEQPQPGIYSAVVKDASGVIGLELFINDACNQMSGILLKGDTSLNIYYPHTASEGGWATGIVAYNPSNTYCAIMITPYDEAGNPLLPNSQTEFIAGKEKYIGIVSDLGLPEDTAWLKIEATIPITGFELFARTNQLAGYTCVGISRKEGVFAKLEKDGSTGISFVNTGDSIASILLTAYDDNGIAITTETVNLAGHAKIVDFAPDLFAQDISSATYITYSSDLDVVGFQLNGSADDMMLDGLPGM
jgi:hypothetical protein